MKVEKIFDSPYDALEYIEKSNVDVVITDVKMPQMNGIELCEKIKSIKNDIIIVLFSAYKDFEAVRSAIKYGIFDYITKPIDYNRLKELCVRINEKISQSYEDEKCFNLDSIYAQELLNNYFADKSDDPIMLADFFKTEDIDIYSAPPLF